MGDSSIFCEKDLQVSKGSQDNPGQSWGPGLKTRNCQCGPFFSLFSTIQGKSMAKPFQTKLQL